MRACCFMVGVLLLGLQLAAQTGDDMLRIKGENLYQIEQSLDERPTFRREWTPLETATFHRFGIQPVGNGFPRLSFKGKRPKAFFCRWEWELERQSSQAFRFRLGNLEYVDYLEQKNIHLPKEN